MDIFDDIGLQLQALEIDQIVEMLRPRLDGISVSTPIVSAGTMLFRGRLLSNTFHKQKGIKVSDLSYPPAHAVRLGRANRANQPLFYCSASQEVIYYELAGLTTNDEILLSHWRTKRDFLVNNIGYTQLTFENLGARRAVPIWTVSQNDVEINLANEERLKAEVVPLTSKDENREVREALSQAFMCSVGPSEQIRYKLTAAIAEIYMAKTEGHPMQFAGILYPTVRMMANGDNLALKSECADSKLEFVQAQHIKISNKENDTISFSIEDFANQVSNSGELLWKGRAPAFSLPPGAMGTFTLVEGQDENGNYIVSPDGKICHYQAKDQDGNVLRLD